MLILENLNSTCTALPPIGLSIGTFDGLHLGHQALFASLKEKIGKGSMAAFTFKNHPQKYFRPESSLQMLCTPEHKIKLLEELGIDILFLVPFDKLFAEMSYDHFLRKLKNHLPFSYLVLGDGASFGKNREGNPEKIKTLSNELDFEVTYLSKVCKKNEVISSQRIRKALQQGDLLEVAELLGRPYSIYRIGPHIQIQSPKTASLELQDLCLPPDGTYLVDIHSNSENTDGFAKICNQTKMIQIETSKPFFNNSQKAIELLFKKSV